jgi:hypothetical protein
MKLDWGRLCNETGTLVTPVTANSSASFPVTNLGSIVARVDDRMMPTQVSPAITSRHLVSRNDLPDIHGHVTGVTSNTKGINLSATNFTDAQRRIAKVAAWVNGCCSFRDRCFGCIGRLYVHYNEWCLVNTSLPCNRQTFEALLISEDFLCADGLVAGLILTEDLEALNSIFSDSRSKLF